jgi:hypothetical protein
MRLRGNIVRGDRFRQEDVSADAATEVPPEVLQPGMPIPIDAACALLGVGKHSLMHLLKQAGISWPRSTPPSERTLSWEQLLEISDVIPPRDEDGRIVPRLSGDARERMRENGRLQSARNRMRFIYGKKAGRKSA